jgi:hypothetical protein
MKAINQPINHSFYIVAHADDWQLFMQPNAYEDLIAGDDHKASFIITTAGDAGYPETYWRAREEGLKSSVRFCLAPRLSLTESCGIANFNGHSINFWKVNHVLCYFLRLPDGNINGNGFAVHRYESLAKIKAGEINTITAIDGSTIYDSWHDFYTTLQMIILSQNGDAATTCLNYLNPDPNENAMDHADHIATGKAINEMPAIAGMKRLLFVGYTLNSSMNEKLTQKELFWKAGMFAAYEKAVFDLAGYSTLHESMDIYEKWCLSRGKFITGT